MKEFVNDFDIWQDALSKIDMNESALPIYHGHMIYEHADEYQKMQKILNCPEMIECQQYLYDLDPENLEDEDCSKINNLYKLGCDRGFIEDTIDTPDIEALPMNDMTPPETNKIQLPTPYKAPAYKAKIPSYTIMYSATKDGIIKTGESYSNAVNPRSAKADVFSKLSKLGYENISILAIECGDPDCCDYDNSYTPEDDAMNACADGCYGDNCEEGIFESDNPYTKGMKTNNIAGVKSSCCKKVSEDEEEKPAEKTSKPKEEKPAEPKEETPAEKPATEEPTTEEPATEEAPAEEPTETKEEPAAEEAPTEETPTEEVPATEEPATEEPTAEEPATEEAPAEEPTETKEEPAAEEPKTKLDDAKKAELKDEYKKVFKNTMLKCKFEDRTFDDLTIEEKVKFFTELSKVWNKNEPNEFMTDKEIEQLDKVTIEQ